MDNKLIDQWMFEIPTLPNGKQIHPDNEFFLKSRGLDGKNVLVAELDDFVDLNDLPKLQGIVLDLQPKLRGCILTLTLQDSEHLDKFALICFNIAQQTSTYSGRDLILHTIKILNSWSKLFSPSRTKLPESELIGLIGELYALDRHLIEVLNPKLAIRAWIGPEDAKQDIVADNFAIEVKAHHSGFSNKISISSAEQLDIQRERFFLYKIDFSPSEKLGSVSLNSLKDSINSKIETSSEALNEFMFHFSDKTEKATDQQLVMSYALDNESVFNVNAEFPKILLDDIPPAISKDSVKYVIEVSALDDFLLDKRLGELISND
jgi:hypothetical protein